MYFPFHCCLLFDLWVVHQATIPCDYAKTLHKVCEGPSLCHNIDDGTYVSSPTPMDHPAHTPMDQPQITDRVVTGWFQKETTILPPPPLQKEREEEKKTIAGNSIKVGREFDLLFTCRACTPQ